MSERLYYRVPVHAARAIYQREAERSKSKAKPKSKPKSKPKTTNQ
jgi:hypothetical protein